MTRLHCNTVQEALRERAASAGPAPLSPALADHLSSCPGCQSERRSIRELLEVSRGIVDPPPPASIWDGFEAELGRALTKVRSPASGLEWWGRVGLGLAATLVLGFAMGALWMHSRDEGGPVAGVLPKETVRTVASEEYAQDPRLELYLDEIENVLVAYRATEHGDAVDVFRRSVPATMVAGEGAPSEAARQRLEQQRAAREQLRTLVLAMLASEIESERQGFGYIERRIAEIAGQELLILVH
ncbi:MAG: hypothetical protein ACREMK_09125 [Gemmatimonadota bacterium]